MIQEKKNREQRKKKKYQIRSTNTKKVIYRLNEPGDVLLQLKTAKGNIVVTLVDAFQENLGTQTKLIPTNKLQKGKYEIMLKINKNVVSEFFEVP